MNNFDDFELHKELPPTDEKGNFKHKFEVKMRPLGPDPRIDGVEKAIFIDGEQLNFKIDVLRFLEAKGKGMSYLAQEQKKIEKEFVKSVSEYLHRKVLIQDIKKAILEGWI